ncbi:hypothetical protein DSECCO2_619410 [anaerobic digester metagenome]
MRRLALIALSALISCGCTTRPSVPPVVPVTVPCPRPQVPPQLLERPTPPRPLVPDYDQSEL